MVMAPGSGDAVVNDFDLVRLPLEFHQVDDDRYRVVAAQGDVQLELDRLHPAGAVGLRSQIVTATGHSLERVRP